MENEIKKNCKICGHEFYVPPCQESIGSCCSGECRQRMMNEKYGHTTYPVFIEKNKINDFADWFNTEHHIKGKSVKEIAIEFGVVRITLTRWCKKHNLKCRTISEDSKLQFSRLTKEQILRRTKRSRAVINNKIKTDKEWLARRTMNSLKSQNWRRTKIETAMEDEFNSLGLDFVSQFNIGSYYVDFAFPDKRVIVECDGDYWHSLPKQMVSDKRKDRYLTENHWQVVRLKEREIKSDVKSCLNKVLSAINGGTVGF